LRLASVVQRRMIPAQPPSLPGLDIAAEYVPCFELGGDFYDFLPLPNDNLGLGVCDVVGKGVRASLLMASIRASLRAHADNVYAMSEVMAKVNRDLCADSLSSDFATLFYAVIDARTRRMTYANAGHVYPLLVRDGQVCPLDTGGGVLGIDASAAWEHDSFVLQAGDVVLACSDGLTEAMDFHDEQFGTERFEQSSLRAVAEQDTADAILKHVLWEMHRFSGLHESCDDLTLVAVKVL
jgi:phosphoserine phosphatase RsbU/P